MLKQSIHDLNIAVSYSLHHTDSQNKSNIQYLI